MQRSALPLPQRRVSEFLDVSHSRRAPFMELRRNIPGLGPPALFQADGLVAGTYRTASFWPRSITGVRIVGVALIHPIGAAMAAELEVEDILEILLP